MASFEIRYNDSPVDVTMDAWLDRVTLWREGDYIGLFAGALDGHSCRLRGPAARDPQGCTTFHNAMVDVLADAVELFVREGGSLEPRRTVEVWPLDIEDILDRQGRSPGDGYWRNLAVRSFEV